MFEQHQQCFQLIKSKKKVKVSIRNEPRLCTRSLTALSWFISKLDTILAFYGNLGKKLALLQQLLWGVDTYLPQIGNNSPLSTLIELSDYFAVIRLAVTVQVPCKQKRSIIVSVLNRIAGAELRFLPENPRISSEG